MKKTVLLMAGLVCSGISILLTIATFTCYGTIADEFQVGVGVPVTLLLVINVIMHVILLGFYLVSLYKKKKISARRISIHFGAILLSCLVAVTGMAYGINSAIQYIDNNFDSHQRQIDTNMNSNITLAGLSELIESEQDALVYFVRSDCPECIELSPGLEYLFKENAILYYRYNTLDDRENNKEEMQSVLDQYLVKSVPSLVEINCGQIANVYEIDQLRDFLLKE